MANAEYKSYRQNIPKLYLFQFFASLHFIGGVLIPFFTDWGKISFAQIMLLQAWFMLWFFILEIPTGAIADHIGRKNTIAISALFHIAFVLVYASMPNFYMFMLGEFFAALAASLLSGSEEALAYDTLKNIKGTEKSKKVFGNLNNLMLAGIMVASPIGSIIAAKFGLRAPMLLMSVPFAIAMVISLTFKEPKIKRKSKRGIKEYTTLLIDGVKFFHGNKVLKVLALDMIAIATIAYFFIWLYQPMLKQAGIGIAYFGLVSAAFVASQMIIVSNFERLEKLFGSKERLLFLSAAITGITLIIGGLTTMTPIVLAVIIVGGGFGLSREVLFKTYLNKHIPSPKRATVLSTISAFRRLALVVINPIVGFMVQWSLNYTLIILGAAAIIFALVSRVEEEHLID